MNFRMYFTRILFWRIFSYIFIALQLVSCSLFVPGIQTQKTLASTPFPTSMNVVSETSPPPDEIPHPSILTFDHISGDAGNFYLLAGETITFKWENPPDGADGYEFRFVSQKGEPPVLVGSDFDASDSVSFSWVIPENITGELHATAFFSDGEKVDLLFPPMIYSGDLPPAGVCSLLTKHQPIEVYRLPDRSSEVFAQLLPGIYAHVLALTPDGWYRIDASVAEEYSSPRGSLHENGFHDYEISLGKETNSLSVSGEGWVNGDKGILLIGDCSFDKRMITYYFVTIEETPYPEGSVVIMEDTYILAPTISDIPFSDDTAADLKQALQAVLNDPRNGWESNNLEIVEVTFEGGHAEVVLQGDYFGVGDVTLIAARMQILLTLFANPTVQTASVTLNGDTIGNLGVSNSMWAKTVDYIFTRSEIDTFRTENAYASP